MGETRTVREERRDEAQLEISEVEEHHADLWSQTANVRRSCFRAAAAALGGLSLLMVAGIFTRYIFVIRAKNELQKRFDDLDNNHSRLEEEVKQLQVKISEAELSRLNRDSRCAELCCPDGWRIFGCSCYFKASERRNWEESRTDCRSRDADLVVVNSREEQEFIRKLTEPEASWIGLKAQFQHKAAGWEPRWEWVDGSSLMLMFWEAGHSLKAWHRYVACCSEQGRWTQSRYYESNHWICERTTSCRC